MVSPASFFAAFLALVDVTIGVESPRVTCTNWPQAKGPNEGLGS